MIERMEYSQSEQNIAMEVIPEGACPLCKQQTDQEIVAIDVSWYGHAVRRFGCLECKDRVSRAVLDALVSIAFY